MRASRTSRRFGSDGRSQTSTLTPEDDIGELDSSPTHMPDDSEVDNIAEYAIKDPENVKLHSPKDVIITTSNNQPFGLQYHCKIRGHIAGKAGLRYVHVAKIEPGSPAAATCIRPGDLILSMNNHELFQVEDHAAAEEFGSRFNRILEGAKKCGTLKLFVQSPRGMKPHSSSGRLPNIEPLVYLENIVKVCPELTRSKLPYSKLIVIGDNSKRLVTKMFKARCESKCSGSFSRFGVVVERTEHDGFAIQVPATCSDYRRWMQSSTNLRQLMDEANKNELHRKQHYHFVDVLALSSRRGVHNGVIGSACMGEGDVLVYQVDTERLRQHPNECSHELACITHRLHSFLGHSVPVIIAATSETARSQEQDSVGEIARQLHQDNCSIMDTVFLGLEPETDSCYSSLTSNMQPEEECNDSSSSPVQADALNKVMNIVWAQKFPQAFSARLLIYLELFWKMVAEEPHRGFTRGTIKGVCRIRDEKELNDFVAFLEMAGEVLIVRSNTVFESIVPRSYILPFFLRLISPPTDTQDGNFREQWKRFISSGIASSTFLEQLFGLKDISILVTSLQELKVLVPLGHFTTERNDNVRKIANEKEEFFFIKHSVETSSGCRCGEGIVAGQLRVKFESRMPTDFLERLVFRIVDASREARPSWKVAGPCGCLEFITRDGCAALFKEDPLSNSVTIFPCLSDGFRPVDLLRLIRKSVHDTITQREDEVIIGCDCPRCQDQDHQHVLSLDPDAKNDLVHCGMERLNDHRLVRHWIPGPQTGDIMSGVQDPECRSWPSIDSLGSSLSRDLNDNVLARPSDDISRLKPEVYLRLCQRLNLLDNTSFKDWRMLAGKLGCTTDDIDLFSATTSHNGACGELFRKWRLTGHATITRLMGILVDLGRLDVATKLLMDCDEYQPDILHQIESEKPGQLQRIKEQLNL